MKRYTIAIALLLSCASPERAQTTLEEQGFTRVRITGYAWTGCGRGDDTCTGFEALSPIGHRVRGVVGCGYNTGCDKGCTVRIEP